MCDSPALQRLADAPGNAKLVRVDGAIVYAGAEIDHPVMFPVSDPAAAKLPVGGWLRRRHDGHISGFLPYGAARAIHEVRAEGTDVAAVFGQLTQAITGEGS